MEFLNACPGNIRPGLSVEKPADQCWLCFAAYHEFRANTSGYHAEFIAYWKY